MLNLLRCKIYCLNITFSNSRFVNILYLRMTEIDDEKLWENFLDRMKKSTKSVHDVQDIAINGLFVISLYAGGATELWFQALARFEIVFNELEDALDNEKELEIFDMPGLRIKEKIKRDLDGFYGKDRTLNSPAIKT